MSDAIAIEPGAAVESLEGARSHELQRDEDVLSLELQAALESAGTALGFIAAFALLFSQLPRAGRLIASVADKPSPKPEVPNG